MDNLNEISDEVLLGILENTINPCMCIKCIEEGGQKKYKIVYRNTAYMEKFPQTETKLTEEYCSEEEIEKLYKREDNTVKITHTQDVLEEGCKLIYLSSRRRYLKVKKSSPVEGFVCYSFDDVTEFVRAKDELQKMYELVEKTSEELKYQVDLLTTTKNSLEITNKIHELVAEEANDGFYYKNHNTGMYIVSNSLRKLCGMTEEEEIDIQRLQEVVLEDDYKELMKIREDTIKEHKDRYSAHIRMKESSIWLVNVTRFFYGTEGNVSEEVSFFMNITEQKQQQEKLENMAYNDINTGLLNRTYFTTLLNQDIEQAKREDVAIELLYIDIDNLKSINDSIGYKLGDELVIKFSSMLKKLANDSVKIARFDSDEFVMEIYDGSRYIANSMAVNIRKMLQAPIKLNESTQVHISVSIGIAEYPESGRKAADLIANADIALHEVKENGKNGVKFFEEKMLEKFLINLEIEELIKKSLNNDSFELYFQPQYYTADNKLRGLEALIRINDSELGTISPVKFIPVAEKNGTILDIGNWVIKMAIKSLKELQENYGYDGVMSINISAVQFNDITFEKGLLNIIREYDVKPETVEIEITESVFLGNMFRVVEIIKRLRGYGIKISLDDFGTGYSSLSYLMNIPIDTLKIDKTFVDYLGKKKESNIITSSLVDMVKKMGLEIIAEGVETQEQYDFLKNINCDNIQGYLLGKPMKLQDIKESIKNQK